MIKSNLDCAVASTTVAVFLLLAGTLFPFTSILAESIDLNGSIPLGAGSISGTLRGDLTGNILTLNNPSGSKIHIDTKASGPLPPGTIPGSFTYVKEFLVRLPLDGADSVSYNVEFTITPHFSTNLIIPSWSFDISGRANLGTGATKLMAIPQLPKTIGSINVVSTPTFSGKITTNLDPVTAALAQASLNTTLAELNSSGVKLRLSLTGKWEKLSIRLATMALTQMKPYIKIDLDLASSMLAGNFDYRVDLSFKRQDDNFMGNIFKEEIEDLIEVELMNRLLIYIDHEFDREMNGKFGRYKQNCSSQKLGATRIGTSCNISAQFTLIPNYFKN